MIIKNNKNKNVFWKILKALLGDEASGLYKKKQSKNESLAWHSVNYRINNTTMTCQMQYQIKLGLVGGIA